MALLAVLVGLISQTFWFFLPGLVANMAPVFAHRFNWLQALNYPLDGYRHLAGQPLLGPNKTVRGLLVGLIAGGITGFIEAKLQPFLPASLLPFLQSWPMFSSPGFAFLWGSWLGFGALLGDALKSFLKRRLHIIPGQAWWPWDNIDVVIGMILVSWPIYFLSWAHIITAFITIGLAMYVVSFMGVRLGIKQSI